MRAVTSLYTDSSDTFMRFAHSLYALMPLWQREVMSLMVMSAGHARYYFSTELEFGEKTIKTVSFCLMRGLGDNNTSKRLCDTVAVASESALNATSGLASTLDIHRT